MLTPRPTSLAPAGVTALLAAALALTPRLAQAQDPPIEFMVNSPVMVGTDSPILTLLLVGSEDPVEDATLLLRRRGHRSEHHIDSIRRGRPAEIELESPVGVAEWTGELSGTWREAPFELDFEFEFEVADAMEFQVPLDRFDLEGRQFVLTINRPADHVDYEVMGDDGRQIGSGTVAFSGEPPGTELIVPWEQRADNLMKITLRVHDTSGFWTELELIPWSVDIPHEEVHFATGSAVIEAAEQPKIDDAYQQLTEAVDRYGDLVNINLYIAGYTDTVGSRADNLELSEQRARSIARAFRQRGFEFPIYYQGFGEDVLATPTPDETDEIRNRRALYVLAAQPPLPSPQIPRDDWRSID